MIHFTITKKYKPSEVSNTFLPSMSDLSDAENFEISQGELQEKCQSIIFTETQDEAVIFEKSTRLQVKCSNLDCFRSGHITALKFRKASSIIIKIPN